MTMLTKREAIDWVEEMTTNGMSMQDAARVVGYNPHDEMLLNPIFGTGASFGILVALCKVYGIDSSEITGVK
jgi:hypothetical protein